MSTWKEFKKKVLDCLIIPFVIICAAFVIIIIIIQFVIGIVYNGQCPIQPLVPIYNLVAGSTGIAIIISTVLFAATYHLHRCNATVILVPPAILLGLLVLFQIIWGIVGGYYIFPLRTNNITQYETPNLPTYCHPTLFWMSFVVLVLYFVVLALVGLDFFAWYSNSD